MQVSGCYDFFLVATFLPTLDRLLTVINVQSAEGVSLITTEQLNVIFVFDGATLNAANLRLLNTLSWLPRLPAFRGTVPDPVTSTLSESSDNINIVHVQSTPSPNSSPTSCQLPTSSAHIKGTSGLKGMIINCNSLKGPSRFSEFQVPLDFYKPDIIFGCESKLDCEVPTYSVFPPSYSVLRKDRNRNGGAVFVVIKSEFVCKEKPTFGRDCEIIWSTVKIGNCKTLSILLQTTKFSP